MHQTHLQPIVTPLKIIVESNEAGIGTQKGMEIFPYTPTTCARYNIDFKPIRNRDISKDYRLEGLRPYQIEDISFLLARKSAGCFNEPRTGKSVTALKTFELRELKNFIIIAPSSSLYQWKQEVQQWTNYDATIYEGTKAKRAKILKEWQGGVLIMTYDILRERGTHGDISAITKLKVEGVILDEGHRIRNRKTATTRAIFKLKNVPHKLVLTGTSVIRKPEELWTLLHFLYPSTFSSYWKFIYYFFNVKEESIYLASGPQKTLVIGSVKHCKEQELTEMLNNISTNRKRKEVMQWLPNKDYLDIRLDMTATQQKYIKELRESFETEHIITAGILDTIIRERQILLAPSLVGLKGGGVKKDWLEQYIKDNPDKPMLIFSKFTAWLEYLSKELGIEHMITGKQNHKERYMAKEKFQAGNINILLLNIDAAKEALTLDRAEVAIFTDRFQPIGYIQQAEDRFVSTKENVDKPHLIINLIMKDSYEENIHESLKKSAKDIDIINDYKKYLQRYN